MQLDLQPVAKQLDLQPVAKPPAAKPMTPDAAKTTLDLFDSKPQLDLQPATSSPAVTAPKIDLKPVAPGTPDKTYANLLPVGHKASTDKNFLAFPQIARDIGHTIELPGKVIKGEVPPDKMEDAALDTALLVAGGGIVGGAEKTAAKAAAKEATSAAKNPGVLKSLQNIVSPTSAGPGAKAMETTIRERTGLANRSTAENEALLAKSVPDVAKLTPEDTLAYYDHVENVSAEGAKPLPANVQGFADDTRTVMQGMRKRLEEMPDGEKMGFYQDYFPHYWKNPEQARLFTNDFIGKQGSAAATKGRKYPTIADGLRAGLELADPNPIRSASRYVTSTNNYIASKEIAEQALKKGDAKYFPPGQQPEGWVPLTGRFAQRPASGHTLYAPKDVALIYNNFYSKGFEATQLASPYEALRTITAENTAAELALSAYHLSTITAQNLFNDVARVAKNALTGDWKGVGQAVKSATAGQLPGVKGGNYAVGSKFIEQYKGLKDHGIDMETVADHFAKSGGKVGQEQLYRANPEGGFVKAWKQGQLGSTAKELKDTAMTGPAGAIKATWKTLGKVAEDISYPLFEHYIPRIKTGAFANLMGDWLRQNPKATETEIAKARINLMDMVDDRFGEMNMDNIFWNKLTKQIGALTLRAQGWDIGLVRQAGGGALDAGRIARDFAKTGKFDKQLADRPLFLASAVMTTMLVNSAYQYLKTGKPPESLKDTALPQTGGKTPYGVPERAMMPGHARELIQMQPEPGGGIFSGLAHEASNKIASFPKNVYEAIDNKDFKDQPIGSPMERVAHVAEGFTPISMGDGTNPKKGTEIGPVERNLGIRPAGVRFTEPERVERAVKKKEKQSMKAKKRYDNRQKMQEQPE